MFISVLRFPTLRRNAAHEAQTQCDSISDFTDILSKFKVMVALQLLSNLVMYSQCWEPKFHPNKNTKNQENKNIWLYSGSFTHLAFIITNQNRSSTKQPSSVQQLEMSTIRYFGLYQENLRILSCIYHYPFAELLSGAWSNQSCGVLGFPHHKTK